LLFFSQIFEWLAAKGSALAGFANGFARDLDAIRAALWMPWSTGVVEGQISHQDRPSTRRRT
jgi:transposase